MVCERCHGNCCKIFIVFVTAHDVARIIRGLNIDPTCIINYYPEEIDSNYPSFKMMGKDYVLGLDSKHGSMKDCKFLMELGSYRRCGIHKLRPMNCRTYPFILDGNNLDFVEEFVCPKQWWPEGEERKGYVDNIIQHHKELEEYKGIVMKWNKNHSEKGSFIEFLDFIIKDVPS